MRSGMSRRDLLRGRLKGGARGIRPPWAMIELTDLCDRCGDCVPACPEGILVLDIDGLPQVDFARGGCSFCGACVKACGPGALAFPEDATESPWSLVAVIADTCLSSQGVVCRSCAETCSEAAIHFRLRPAGRAVPLLDANACTGCGRCFRVCPVGAISLQERRSAHGE